MITLSKKIHFVLLVVFTLFIGIGMFANYQYGAIQRKNNLKERIRYNSQMSQIDSNEIVSSMMLNQENAILLYLNKIKSRDELEFIEVLGSEAYEAEISGYKCMWGELLDQNACVIKNGNSYNFYHKMTYGSGNFGYLKKVFSVEQSNILLPNEISKFLLIISLIFIIVLFVLSAMLEKNVVKPLHVIRNHLQPLRTGKFDIHIPKQATEEMNSLTHDIINIIQELKKYQDRVTKTANLAAIGESVAMVAHDVRTPLTSMKALLSVLPVIKDDPVQVKKMIAAVDINIANTNAMLNDILDFSRDSTALELKDHAPLSIITFALGEALRNHPNADVKIEYDFNHGSASLYADGERITRALTNIIDNALGAIANGDGKAFGILWVRTEKDDKHLIIAIADSGPGIPDVALSRIFDPFFTLGKKDGTGLGLTICKKIIDMHSGRIEARNRCDGKMVRLCDSSEDVKAIKPSDHRTIEPSHKNGAEFIIELLAGKEQMTFDEAELIHNSKELKLFRQEEAARTDYGDTANVQEFMLINKKRGRTSNLLIVDDEPLFRESIRCVLNTIDQVKDHVKFIEAGSAEEGLDFFKVTEFDYLIADIDLGKNRMNGYDFVQKILAEYPNTYVIIYSNKRKEELDMQIRQRVQNSKSEVIRDLRFMGFLPKPMKASELLQFLACKSFEVQSNHLIIEPSHQKKVLLLNDDKNFNLAMRMMLKGDGIQVLDATNVSDAIKHLADGKNKYDAILSDINLGENEPSGYDFLKQVREQNKQIPFIFVSGYGKKEEWPKAEKLGATGYIQLPFEPEKFKEMLKWDA